MLEKLNEKDQKTVKMAGLAILAFLVTFGFYYGQTYWTEQKKDTERFDDYFETLNLKDAAHKQLLADVPNFQMPVDESNQKTLFRNSLNALFEENRISTDPWVLVQSNSATRPPTGYGVLCLKTSSSGTVSFQNILNLLAALKENPYLAGIEEFKITCDPQNPQVANLSIVLSTFVNNKKRAR